MGVLEGDGGSLATAVPAELGDGVSLGQDGGRAGLVSADPLPLGFGP